MPARPAAARVPSARAAARTSVVAMALALASCADPAAAPDRSPSPEPATDVVTSAPTSAPSTVPENPPMSDELVRSDAEWKALLTPEQYRILREKGTERAFTGAYWDTKTPGVYRCAGCGTELFRSESKFDSGCGWPSFDRELAKGRIVETPDTSFGMLRTEVTCARCGGHLGHLFDDGPTETGMRYCINSVSIRLEPDARGTEPGRK